jgi:hypothetical protein
VFLEGSLRVTHEHVRAHDRDLECGSTTRNKEMLQFNLRHHPQSVLLSNLAGSTIGSSVLPSNAIRRSLLASHNMNHSILFHSNIYIYNYLLRQ